MGFFDNALVSGQAEHADDVNVPTLRQLCESPCKRNIRARRSSMSRMFAFQTKSLEKTVAFGHESFTETSHTVHLADAENMEADAAALV